MGGILGYIENRRPAWADPISKEARQMQESTLTLGGVATVELCPPLSSCCFRSRKCAARPHPVSSFTNLGGSLVSRPHFGDTQGSGV